MSDDKTYINKVKSIIFEFITSYVQRHLIGGHFDKALKQGTGEQIW